MHYLQKQAIGLALAAVIVPQFVAAPASAEETTCTGSLGAITVDNLRVPQGATCTLSGTRVEGTIVVEANATLRANKVQVKGNVQAEGAARVNVLARSTVGGSIQIVQGGAARIDSVQIEGSAV